MWLEDVKPCKAYVEATGQEVMGVLGFRKVQIESRWIIDENKKNKFQIGHVALIPVFKTVKSIELFDGYSNVHTEKLDFKAYCGVKAGTNTVCLVGCKTITKEEYNKMTDVKR